MDIYVKIFSRRLQMGLWFKNKSSVGVIPEQSFSPRYPHEVQYCKLNSPLGGKGKDLESVNYF